MKGLFKCAREVELFLQAKNWKFCFIGGLALQRWGRQRLTRDVDLTILTGYGDEEHYITGLLKNFKGRRTDAAEFALRNRVVLLEDSSGIGIDVSLGAMFFEESAIARASQFEFLPGISLTTCSAEDLIVFKTFANRLQDRADVEGILERQMVNLDFKYIESQLIPLLDLKEEPEILDEFRKLIVSVKKTLAI